MMAEAIQFCRQQQYRSLFLTTLPRLDAAMHLYAECGFTLVAQNERAFHGSQFVEQTVECRLD
jgi:N-acetylglutamate synthase-like GNAT family acetyltransferase